MRNQGCDNLAEEEKGRNQISQGINIVETDFGRKITSLIPVHIKSHP